LTVRPYLPAAELDGLSVLRPEIFLPDAMKKSCARQPRVHGLAMGREVHRGRAQKDIENPARHVPGRLPVHPPRMMDLRARQFKPIVVGG
jgi:hypothetical protein